jgi:hypothetical protein
MLDPTCRAKRKLEARVLAQAWSLARRPNDNGAIHYYVIDLFSYFYGQNAIYSLKYVARFLVHIFYFIYNKNIQFMIYVRRSVAARKPK